MESFWNGKKVLITGVTGFKGAWLFHLLKQYGADVCGLGLESYDTNDIFNRSLGFNDNIKLINILDIKQNETFFLDCQPDLVFHMAAKSLVADGFVDPHLTYETNILGSYNVLDAAVKTNAKAVIMVTSDKSYFNDDRRDGYCETDQLGGKEPYSASKACAEIVSRCFFESQLPKSVHERGFGIATVRAGNVIGGGDRGSNRIIPDIVRAMESDEIIYLRNPKSSRPWQYILDCLSGYLLVAQDIYERSETSSWFDSWNIGSNESCLEVSDITNTFIRCYGNEGYPTDVCAGHFFESQTLSLNCEKFDKKFPDFKRLSVEESLDATAKWYLYEREAKDMVAFTNQQILAYASKSK